MMEDYEIREALNRSTTPDLYLRMGLAQTPTEVILAPNSLRSEPFGINAAIGNRSPQPSFYTVVHLFADNRLEGSATGYQVGAPAQTKTGVPLNRWINKLGIPGHFPIFAETEFSVLDGHWLLTMPAELIGTQQIFAIGYMITAPGFSSQRFGKLFLTDGTLTLVMDPSLASIKHNGGSRRISASQAQGRSASPPAHLSERPHEVVGPSLGTRIALVLLGI